MNSLCKILLAYGISVIIVVLLVLEGSIGEISQPFAVVTCIHENCDISNWLALVVGVGIPIAFSLHLWNKGRKIEKKRIHYSHDEIALNLSNTRNVALGTIRDFFNISSERRSENPSGNINKNTIDNFILFEMNIEKVLEKSADILDPFFVMEMNRIMSVFREVLKYEYDTEKIRALHSLINLIERQFKYEPLKQFKTGLIFDT